MNNKVKHNYKSYVMLVSIVLLVVLFIGKKKYDTYKKHKQFTKVKEALYLLSLHLNKGNNAIYDVSSTLLKGSNAVAELDVYENTVHKVIKKINE